MITKKDLEAAIAECQGKREPNAKDCMMLAAFYTIKNEMFGSSEKAEYSYAPAPVRNTIEMNSESEFARAVDGKSVEDVLNIMEELMETLNVIQPRLYDAVLDKLS